MNKPHKWKSELITKYVREVNSEAMRIILTQKTSRDINSKSYELTSTKNKWINFFLPHFP